MVIGAGAMGSAVAWHLARRGKASLLLEQLDLNCTKGAWHRQTRDFSRSGRHGASTSRGSPHALSGRWNGFGHDIAEPRRSHQHRAGGREHGVAGEVGGGTEPALLCPDAAAERLAETVADQAERGSGNEDDDVQVRPQPPVPQVELARLEPSLGRARPCSHRARGRTGLGL
eukprot:GHVU01172196.1.p1 GENE.GHVU01172196.1~~GHVU01172196.1.p1  ORF type:complete len:172 (+),score=7.58 GHVU01172196.1:276-791(+)